MKITKRSENLIIASIYIITLFLGVNTFFEIGFIDTIRHYLLVILPGCISLSILFDNIKNLKVLLKHKVPLILYALSIIWLILTFIFGIKITLSSLKGLVHFSVLLTLLFVLFNCEFEERTLKNIKKHLFISFTITVILGILQYITGYHINTGSNEKYPGILGRINSTFYIATTYDKYIVLMFPLITYELLKDKNNIYYRLLLILSALGIIFTFSRSGLLIYFAMSFIFFIVTLFKRQFKSSILMVVLIIGMFLIPGAKYPIQSALDYAYDAAHLPSVLRLNFLDLFGTEKEHVEAGVCTGEDCVGDIEGSNFFRKYYERVGKAFIKEYPIFGVGIGNATYLYENQNAAYYLKNSDVISDEYPYMYPHNCYVQLTEETGFIGTILIFAFLLSLAVIKIINVIKTKEKLIIYALTLILLGLFLAMITEGMFYSKQGIYIFAVEYALLCNIQIPKETKKEKNKTKNSKNQKKNKK